MKSLIPFCYYPTNIILVDDDYSFLSAMKINLMDYYPCQTFDNAEDALARLEAYMAHPFLKHCIDNEVDVDERDVQASIRQIHHEIYRPDRFDNISIAIVDYQMPAVNGIECCEQIRALHPEIRIIMLTGEADDELAIQAFNDGIIDQFLRKDHSELFSSMYSAIQKQQYLYFQALSIRVKSGLMSGTTMLSSCLEDKYFAEFFCDFLIKQQVREYYLLQSEANFLLIMETGDICWFMVRNETEFAVLEEIVCDANCSEQNSIISAIKSRKQLPFFYSEDEYALKIEQWLPYMQDLTSIECGGQQFYYAFIENLPNEPINKGDIALLT